MEKVRLDESIDRLIGKFFYDDNAASILSCKSGRTCRTKHKLYSDLGRITSSISESLITQLFKFQ